MNKFEGLSEETRNMMDKLRKELKDNDWGGSDARCHVFCFAYLKGAGCSVEEAKAGAEIAQDKFYWRGK